MPLAWAVDQFLDAGRRAQNAMLHYVARAFGTSAPESMHQFVDAAAKRVAKKYARRVPATVGELIGSYWHDQGLTLKHYRDRAQHRVIVSSDVAVQIGAHGPRLRFLLPSNPAEQALARIAYGPPYVNAVSYCRRAFGSLATTAYALNYLLLRYTGVSARFSASLLRHPMAVGGDDDSESPPVDEVSSFVETLLSDSFPSLVSRFCELGSEVLAGPARDRRGQSLQGRAPT